MGNRDDSKCLYLSMSWFQKVYKCIFHLFSSVFNIFKDPFVTPDNLARKTDWSCLIL